MNVKKTLAEAQSFSEILPIAKKCKAETSFWGTRYISICGQEDTLQIDSLAERLIDLIKQNPQFNENERTCGQELAKYIDRIYDASDESASRSNCITQLFILIRACWNAIFASRIGSSTSVTLWFWKGCENIGRTGYRQIFDHFTLEQYKTKFGHSPNKEPECEFQSIPFWNSPK